MSGVPQPLDSSEEIVCAVDVSNRGAGGVCWFRGERQCSYYRRRLPEPMMGATGRDSCRAELTNLMAATRLWGEQWRGRSVVVRSDHPCVARGRSRSRRRMRRMIDKLSRRHGFQYRLEWSIKAEDPLMAAADALSRSNNTGHAAVARAVDRNVQASEVRPPEDDLFFLDDDDDRDY